MPDLGMDIYLRVSRASTQRQESDAYHSPDIQKNAALRWAGVNEVAVGVIEKDENVSGNRAVRDRKLDRLIQRVEDGLSAGIIVYNVKRFGRNMVESCVAVARVRDAGGRIVSVEDGADTDRSMLQFDIMTALGAEELRARTQGWADAVTAAVDQGKHVASRAPQGYLRRDLGRKDVKDARLILDPQRAPDILEAFEMRAAGRSHSQIARFLGVSKSTVSSLLQNRAYLGEARGPNGTVNPSAHTRIVTDELFAAVQMRRGTRVTQRDDWEYHPLVQGIIKCSECGSLLQVTRRTSGGQRLPSYVCMTPYTNGLRGCRGCSADCRKVDDWVVEQLDLDDAVIGELFHGTEIAWSDAQKELKAAEDELEQFVETALGLRRDLFQRGLQTRENAVQEAKSKLYGLEDPGYDPEREFSYLDGNGERQTFRYEARGDDPARDRLRMSRVIRSLTLKKAESTSRYQDLDKRLTLVWKGTVQ